MIHDLERALFEIEKSIEQWRAPLKIKIILSINGRNKLRASPDYTGHCSICLQKELAQETFNGYPLEVDVDQKELFKIITEKMTTNKNIGDGYEQTPIKKAFQKT